MTERRVPVGKWMTVPGFAAAHGYTVGAIHQKRHDGTWLEGVMWQKAPDGRVLINTEAFAEWVESGGKSQMCHVAA